MKPYRLLSTALVGALVFCSVLVLSARDRRGSGGSVRQTRAASSHVNQNVNRNVNRNTNVNANRNVNVNRNVGYRGVGYGAGAAVAVGAAAAAGAAAAQCGYFPYPACY